MKRLTLTIPGRPTLNADVARAAADRREASTPLSRWARGRAAKVAGAVAYRARKQVKHAVAERAAAAASTVKAAGDEMATLKAFEQLVFSALALEKPEQKHAFTSSKLVPFIQANAKNLPEHTALLALSAAVIKYKSVASIDGVFQEMLARTANDERNIP